MMPATMSTTGGTEWIGYTTETAGSVSDLVAGFQPRDLEAGHKAAKFLKEEALVNAGMSRTHLCVSDQRLEGFISCCSGSVTLSERSIRSLGFRTGLKIMPAVLVTWVARHGEGVVPGWELMATAYGLAREATSTIAAVALVVDPADDQVAEVWKGEPYNFRESEHRRGRGAKGPKRLWLPLEPEPLAGADEERGRN
jgi:hypothetical protein